MARSMSNSGNKNQSNEFDLPEFISRNSELFVILGVFAAISIYISQLPQDYSQDLEIVVKAGTFSSFAISFLMYLLIYQELWREFGGFDSLKSAHLQLRNILLISFSFFSIVLMTSVFTLLMQNEPVVFLLLVTAIVYLGFGVMLKITDILDNVLPESSSLRIVMYTGISTIILAATHGIYVYYLSEFEVTTIQNLSISDPGPVFVTVGILFVTSLRSAAALGTLFGMIGIGIVALRIIGKAGIGRIRG